MKETQDYIRDIAEVRSMMERSSKFLALSGMAGIITGIIALLGAFIAFRVFDFNPETISGDSLDGITNVVLVALGVFILAAAIAIYFSWKKATGNGEKIWNPVSRRLLVNVSIPFVTGAVLILILLSKGLTGLLAPFSLVFYGLALVNASKFTYNEIRIIGIIQVILGLISSWYINLGLICWAAGFGVAHIIYGIYMQKRYGK